MRGSGAGRHHGALRLRHRAVAVPIGGIAGVLVCAAVFFIERRLRIDDPVGAISVHLEPEPEAA
jgi:hypothetical protein